MFSLCYCLLGTFQTEEKIKFEYLVSRKCWVRLLVIYGSLIIWIGVYVGVDFKEKSKKNLFFSWELILIFWGWSSSHFMTSLCSPFPFYFSLIPFSMIEFVVLVLINVLAAIEMYLFPFLLACISLCHSWIFVANGLSFPLYW